MENINICEFWVVGIDEFLFFLAYTAYSLCLTMRKTSEKSKLKDIL